MAGRRVAVDLLLVALLATACGSTTSGSPAPSGVTVSAEVAPLDPLVGEPTVDQLCALLTEEEVGGAASPSTSIVGSVTGCSWAVDSDAVSTVELISRPDGKVVSVDGERFDSEAAPVRDVEVSGRVVQVGPGAVVPTCDLAVTRSLGEITLEVSSPAAAPSDSEWEAMCDVAEGLAPVLVPRLPLVTPTDRAPDSAPALAELDPEGFCDLAGELTTSLGLPSVQLSTTTTSGPPYCRGGSGAVGLVLVEEQAGVVDATGETVEVHGVPTATECTDRQCSITLRRPGFAVDLAVESDGDAPARALALAEALDLAVR